MEVKKTTATITFAGSSILSLGEVYESLRFKVEIGLCGCSRRRAICAGGSVPAFGPEEQQEQDENHECAGRRNQPDRMPVVRDLEAFVRGCRRIGTGRVGRGVAVHHSAGHERADEVSEPVGDEVDESLRRGTHFLARALVGINLPRDEEEIVADAMEKNPDIDKRHYRANSSH